MSVFLTYLPLFSGPVLYWITLTFFQEERVVRKRRMDCIGFLRSWSYKQKKLRYKKGVIKERERERTFLVMMRFPWMPSVSNFYSSSCLLTSTYFLPNYLFSHGLPPSLLFYFSGSHPLIVNITKEGLLSQESKKVKFQVVQQLLRGYRENQASCCMTHTKL